MSRSTAASDDQSAQLILGAVEAKLLAAKGEVDDARELSEETVLLADGTDGLNLIAFTRVALAEVLQRPISTAKRVASPWRRSICSSARELGGSIPGRRPPETRSPRIGRGPPKRAPSVPHVRALAAERAAVRVCDERSREREQTDCEHDERAVQ